MNYAAPVDYGVFYRTSPEDRGPMAASVSFSHGENFETIRRYD